MTDLIIIKAVFVIVMALASVRLHRCAMGAPRLTGDWYAGHVLSVLLAVMAVSELGHLIALVRGGGAL